MPKLWRSLVGRTSSDEISRYGIDQYAADLQLAFNGQRYILGGGSTGYTKTEDIESSFTGYINSMYKSNGIVFAIVLARMMLFTEGRFCWWEITDNGEDGKAAGRDGLGVLEKPWPNGGTGELLARMEQDASLGGNFYATREQERLRRLRPDWVTIVLTAPPAEATQSDVQGYWYHPGRVYSNAGDYNAGDTVYLPDEICHFSPIPDPDAQYRGMSWLTPVVREVMADKSAMEHKLNFFTNGATLGTIIAAKENLTPTQFAEWQKNFNAGHQGVANAYRPTFFASPVDVTVSGSDLQQLDFKVTTGAGETRLCAAGGVPPIIVGLSEGLASATYSNYGMARRKFGDHWALPQWKFASVALSSVVDSPKPDLRLGVNVKDIAFLREDRKDQVDITKQQILAIEAGVRAGVNFDALVDAVAADDITLLKGQHSGLFSVQLQPPGSQDTDGDGHADTTTAEEDATGEAAAAYEAELAALRAEFQEPELARSVEFDFGYIDWSDGLEVYDGAEVARFNIDLDDLADALANDERIAFDDDSYLDWSTRSDTGAYTFAVEDAEGNFVEFDLSPDEFDQLATSLGEVERRRNFYGDAPNERIGAGFKGGGRFRKLSDRVTQALQDWLNGDGDDDPLEGFNREQVRKAAVELGLPPRRGASAEEIKLALLKDARTRFRGTRDKEVDQKTQGATFNIDGKHVAVFAGKDGKISLREESKPDVPGRLVESFSSLNEVEAWADDNGHSRLSAWARKENGLPPKKAVRPRKAAPRKVAPLTGDAALGAAPIDFTKPQGLTPDEERILDFYAGDGAYLINPALRENGGRTVEGDDETADEIAAMDAVMARSPLTSTVRVERGISHGADEDMFGEEKWRGDLTGATLLDYGFQSTTTRPGGGAHYAEQEGYRSEQATLIITVPEGTKAIKLSGDDHESELLLQRGLTIKVTSDSGYDENGGRRIEAEVVKKRPVAPRMIAGKTKATPKAALKPGRRLSDEEKLAEAAAAGKISSADAADMARILKGEKPKTRESFDPAGVAALLKAIGEPDDKPEPTPAKGSVEPAVDLSAVNFDTSSIDRFLFGLRDDPEGLRKALGVMNSTTLRNVYRRTGLPRPAGTAVSDGVAGAQVMREDLLRVVPALPSTPPAKAVGSASTPKQDFSIAGTSGVDDALAKAYASTRSPAPRKAAVKVAKAATPAAPTGDLDTDLGATVANTPVTRIRKAAREMGITFPAGTKPDAVRELFTATVIGRDRRTGGGNRAKALELLSAPTPGSPSVAKVTPDASAGEIAEVLKSPISDEAKRRLLTGLGVPQSSWPKALQPPRVQAPPTPTDADRRIAGFPDVPPGVNVDEDTWIGMSYDARLRAIMDARPLPSGAVSADRVTTQWGTHNAGPMTDKQRRLLADLIGRGAASVSVLDTSDPDLHELQGRGLLTIRPHAGTVTVNGRGLREAENPSAPSPRGAAASFDERIRAARQGSSVEALPPVRVQVDASSGSETSKWKAVSATGVTGPTSGLLSAATSRVRVSGRANPRLRTPDGQPLEDWEIKLRAGYTPEQTAKLDALAADRKAREMAAGDREIRAMDRAMAESPLPSDVVVWRGARSSDIGLPSGDAVGFEWTDAGYVGTSARREVSASFLGGDPVQMRVLVPRGTPAIAITGGGEGEVLLDRGLRFRVVGESRTPAGLRVLDVEIIPHAGAASKVAKPKAAAAKLTASKANALNLLSIRGGRLSENTVVDFGIRDRTAFRELADSGHLAREGGDYVLTDAGRQAWADHLATPRFDADATARRVVADAASAQEIADRLADVTSLANLRRVASAVNLQLPPGRKFTPDELRRYIAENVFRDRTRWSLQ